MTVRVSTEPSPRSTRDYSKRPSRTRSRRGGGGGGCRGGGGDGRKRRSLLQAPPGVAVDTCAGHAHLCPVALGCVERHGDRARTSELNAAIGDPVSSLSAGFTVLSTAIETECPGNRRRLRRGASTRPGVRHRNLLRRDRRERVHTVRRRERGQMPGDVILRDLCRRERGAERWDGELREVRRGQSSPIAGRARGRAVDDFFFHWLLRVRASRVPLRAHRVGRRDRAHARRSAAVGHRRRRRQPQWVHSQCDDVGGSRTRPEVFSDELTHASVCRARDAPSPSRR